MLVNIWGHLRHFITDFLPYLTLITLSFLFLLFSAKKAMKSSPLEHQKNILLIVSFSLFAFILIFSGFEAYFRYRFDESDSLGFLKVNSRWFDRHVVFNNYFFRDRNFEATKKTGVTRIGILGDSIAMGYGIKNVDDRFSNILEKKLRDKKYNVEVYNLGKSGYDTQVEIEEYNKVKNLNFDIIVWEYFLNDAQPKDKSKGTQVLLKEQAQTNLARTISETSYFFDYIYWRIEAKYERTFVELRNADMAAYKDAKNFSRHKEEVQSFIDQLKSEKKKVVVIIFPFMFFLPNYPASDIHKTVRAVFREKEIDAIDLLDYLKEKNAKDLIVSRYDYHPNEYVHNLAAEKLYKKIAPLLVK